MRLSVIIANKNDTIMLGITLRSAIEELSAIPGGGEVVIVDQSDPEEWSAVKAIVPQRYIREGKVQLIHQDNPCLFVGREEATRKAKGEYIFCVDSHVLFGHGVLIDAVHFMNRNKSKKIGFGHTPVNWLCQHEGASRHDMRMLHGTWGKLYDYERPITWKGMPWICRKDWFLNTLNGYGVLSDNRVSWGGGDLYLGLKSWMIGYENWAIPTRPTIHIGPLPTIARKYHRYRVYNKSGETPNYVGFIAAMYALDGDNYVRKDEYKNFLWDKFGIKVDDHLDEVKKIAQKDRDWVLSNSVMSLKTLESTKPWESSVFYKEEFQKLRKVLSLQKAIKEEDWKALEVVINEHDVKTVMEMGAGLSTVLFKKYGLDLYSLETDINYLKKLKGHLKTHEIYHWKNKPIQINGYFDLVFVDGIDPREPQIIQAVKNGNNIIAVHDAYTKPNPQYIKEHLCGFKEIKVNSRRLRVFKK